MTKFCSNNSNIIDILPCDIIKFWFGIDNLDKFLCFDNVCVGNR